MRMIQPDSMRIDLIDDKKLRLALMEYVSFTGFDGEQPHIVVATKPEGRLLALNLFANAQTADGFQKLIDLLSPHILFYHDYRTVEAGSDNRRLAYWGPLFIAILGVSGEPSDSHVAVYEVDGLKSRVLSRAVVSANAQTISVMGTFPETINAFSSMIPDDLEAFFKLVDATGELVLCVPQGNDKWQVPDGLPKF